MSILKYKNGDGIEPTGRRNKKQQPANPNSQYDQYFDGSGAIDQKKFFKDYPMPMPADFQSHDGRPWEKMLSTEQRAANFFSNNPYSFNVATGQWEAGTNSSQGTTHGGNSMDYTGSTSGLNRPEGGMRYVKNPYTGKEVGVPANRWSLNIGYVPQNKKGSILYQKGGKVAGSQEMKSNKTGKVLKGDEVVAYRKAMNAAKTDAERKAVSKKFGM